MSENVWSAADLREMIRKRYPAPEWATLFEVANGTGAGQSRWADAVAMNLWPSRGMAVHGFEVKVSRTDWRKELSQPEKANEVARFCDFWWLVAPEAIVKSGELPLGWGHLAPENDKLKVVANAAQMKPEPLTRHFVGALLRNQSGANEADIERRARVQVAAARRATLLAFLGELGEDDVALFTLHSVIHNAPPGEQASAALAALKEMVDE